MGMTHQQFISSNRVFGCKSCKTHLAAHESIISRNFNGQTGRAFLFDTVVNISLGEAEDRHMTTGLHTVRDIRCMRCGATLGWKYDKAFVTSEKYKEGKFILERNLMAEVE